MMRQLWEEIDWSKCKSTALLSVLIFLMNLFLSNYFTVDETSRNTGEFAIFYHSELIAYIISVLGIAYAVSGLLRKRFYVKLLSGYGLYLLTSYFIIITRNLNNENFNEFDLLNNQFFQLNFLYTLILILIIGSLIQYSREEFSFLKQRKIPLLENQYHNFLLYGLIGSIIINDNLFIDYLKEITLPYLEDGNYLLHLQEVSLLVITYLGLFTALVWIIFKAVKDALKNQASLSLAIASSFYLAIFFNFTLQFGVRELGAILGRYIFPSATIYQITIIFLLSLMVYILCNRYLIATALNITLWSVLSIANMIKMGARSEPVLYSDLKWLKDLSLILSYIDVTVIVYAVLALCGLWVGIVFFQRRYFIEKIISSWSKKLGSLMPIVAAFFFISTTFAHQEHGKIVKEVPILSRLNNWENIEWMGNAVVARQRSVLFVWTKQIFSAAMEEPEGYSKKKIEELVQKYQTRALEINQERTQKIGDQTVIFVLSESFSDPSRISNVRVSVDPIEQIHMIMTDYTSGLMHADGYGGGTANMEFQSLTGLPMYSLSNTISTIYTEVVPNMRYIPSISDFFSEQNRKVIHLGDANTYSRKYVYQRLGFDAFTAAKNGTRSTKHLDRIGEYPSDAATYQAVMEQLNPSQNQFFSVITYQNHAPWHYTDDSEVEAWGDNYSPGENFYLYNYSKMMRQTDLATKAWLDELASLDQKISVVFYGDHLPNFYPLTSFRDNPDSQYLTDYFIWSNFETEKKDYPLVNSSDFPAELLAVTNSRVSPYYALLTDVLQDGSVKNKTATVDSEILNDLKMIEYDLVSGSNYILQHKDFFSDEE